MLVRTLLLLCVLLPSAAQAARRDLVRVEFAGVIRTTTHDPFGQPFKHWRGKRVTGFFLYDPSTPNALTPEQVRNKRIKRRAGGRTSRTLKDETTHLYLQQLPRPGFELKLPGHTVTGSRRSLIRVTYRELDTKNSQFIVKDGCHAYVEYKKRKQHGRLRVDGESVADASTTLHFFDRAQKLERAELPTRFPFTLGKGLTLGARVEIAKSAILFEVTKLTSKRVSR